MVYKGGACYPTRRRGQSRAEKRLWHLCAALVLLTLWAVWLFCARIL